MMLVTFFYFVLGLVLVLVVFGLVWLGLVWFSLLLPQCRVSLFSAFTVVVVLPRRVEFCLAFVSKQCATFFLVSQLNAKKPSEWPDHMRELARDKQSVTNSGNVYQGVACRVVQECHQLLVLGERHFSF